MAYINKETGEIGTIFKLLPLTSNPQFLSEEELLERGIEKYIPEIVEKIETLEEVKETKKKQIKQTYIELTFEGFECSNDITLDCRESDKINWLTLNGIINNTDEAQTIKDFDNNLHTLECSELQTMLNELEGYYKELLSKKWLYEVLIDNYDNIEDVNNFYWRKPVYSDDDEMLMTGWSYWEDN